MNITHRHDWDLRPDEAIALQKDMAGEIITDRPLDLSAVKLVAGVDVSVRENVSRSAVVVMTYPDLRSSRRSVPSSPRPSLTFPACSASAKGRCWKTTFCKLRTVPDVFIFDGMGIMHPRRLGIAAHMGLWLNMPTVGCGKSKLLGQFEEPGQEKGDFSPLIYRSEPLGVVLRTRTNVKPVFISPGHLIDLESSIRLIMACTPKFRLPEPVRAAHKAAGAF